MIVLELPLPPTINHYFARNGSRTYLPAKVQKYRQDVADIVADAGHATITKRVKLFIALHFATRARADLDNRIKGLQDALTRAGVWLDDEQVDELIVVRKHVIKGGKCVVVITEIG